MGERRYAIACPHAAATEAGRAAFEAGGNAVDAALAAACMLAVVYPHMCALGGDVMALVHDGAAHAVNASGRAAGAVEPADGTPRPARWVGAITVPGAAAAWQAMADRWGSRPLAAALGPAAELAERGIPVAPSLARALAFEPGLLAADAGMGGVFAPGGMMLREGDPLVQPTLAATLRRLAIQGVDDLYRGETGARLLAGLSTLGCPLAPSDLAAHRVDVEPPLSHRVGADEVLTMGANSQGFSLPQILSAVTHLELEDPLGAGAPVLAGVFRESARDRERYLADPAWMPDPVDALLTPEHVAALADRARTPVAPAGPPAAPARGDTVALVAADAELSVSMIQSVFYAFGAGVLEPDTGILCHNRGAGFSDDPRSPNARGPGKRPMHTLMPVTVTRDGVPVWVPGTMGGRAQPQIHAQLLLRRLAGAGAAEAVAGPRFVVGELEIGGGDVTVEEDFTAAREGFAAAGVEPVVIPRRSEATGHAHAIVRDGAGPLEAASDPRSDGAAVCS